MAQTKGNDNYPLRVYIENARDEGLGGFTMPLPTTRGKLQPFLDACEIRNPQDVKVVEVHAEVKGLGEILTEAVSQGASPGALEELDFLARRMRGLGDEEREAFAAAVGTELRGSSIAEAVEAARSESAIQTPQMDKERFWEMIDNAREKGGCWQEMYEPLKESLSELGPSAILRWQQIFREYHDLSRKDGLWATVAAMQGGCSDDSFDYFRGWLIAQGKETFMNALADPGSLADLATMRAFAQEIAATKFTPPEGYYEEPRFEGMLHVGVEAYEERPGDYKFYRDAAKTLLSVQEKTAIAGEIRYAADIDVRGSALEKLRENKSPMVADAMLTAADCVEGGMKEDLRGKVVVIRPEVLLPEYRVGTHQLVLVTGGFGCAPDARGRAVYGLTVDSGAHERWNREDILGVAAERAIPEWARRKLEAKAPEIKAEARDSVLEKLREGRNTEQSPPKKPRTSGPEH